MPRLEDISRRAGVSVSTVSRVLRRTPNVKPATASLVEAAMRDVGYSNGNTSDGFSTSRGGLPGSLFVSRTQTAPVKTPLRHRRVALLFPDNRDRALRTPLSGRFLQSITLALASHDLHLVPTLLQENGSLPACIKRCEVDGVIVRGATEINGLDLELCRLPCVWLMSLRRIPRHGDQVADDPETAGTIAANHLVDGGHRELAVFNHMPQHPCYGPRVEAFEATALARGARVTRFEGQAVSALVEQMVRSGLSPDGVFVPLPDAEIHEAYRTYRQLAGEVATRQLAWVACGHDPVAMQTMLPHVYNIDLQAEHIARAAVDLLLWRLRFPREPRRRMTIAPLGPDAGDSPLAALSVATS
jgi:DNA-binding LacI/PurR family transcriptional regulator